METASDGDLVIKRLDAYSQDWANLRLIIKKYWNTIAN